MRRVDMQCVVHEANFVFARAFAQFISAFSSSMRVFGEATRRDAALNVVVTLIQGDADTKH